MTVKKKKSATTAEPGSYSSSSPAAVSTRSTPLRPPPGTASFMPSSVGKRRVVTRTLSSSDEDELLREPEKPEASADDDSEESTLPVRTPRARRRTAAKDTKVLVDDEESDDDQPLVTPTSTRRSARKRTIVIDDSDVEERPGQTSSPVKRRRLVKRMSLSPKDKSENEDSEGGNEDEEDEDVQQPSSAGRLGRKPRTGKQKARELLRRKRAGEVVDEDDLSSSEGEAVRPLYDSDPDNLALNEFVDDEEGVPVEQPAAKERKPPRKKKEKEEGGTSGSGGSGTDLDEDLGDFLVDDDDAPLGVPHEVFLDIPLRFTSHSHKPLKEHFRDALEWLVMFKISPGSHDLKHELYQIAWEKLDDEVSGLAQSKFASAAWKKDFFMALRARPEFTSSELAESAVLES